ncbi:hypothetical protein Goklo_024147 [Gossypium klotzschianum]|uniref:Uncharacterized protein n=1 Tax=Gossypium klotzschianum TaxID=34286 RepID=A0A7J8W9N1_9ROSI|nr:hypothetical protein [Gossypium klotzschianum]
MTQRGKGDSLGEGYLSELWDFTRISVTQNSLQELKKFGISRMMMLDSHSILIMGICPICLI